MMISGTFCCKTTSLCIWIIAPIFPFFFWIGLWKSNAKRWNTLYTSPKLIKGWHWKRSGAHDSGRVTCSCYLESGTSTMPSFPPDRTLLLYFSSESILSPGHQHFTSLMKRCHNRHPRQASRAFLPQEESPTFFFQTLLSVRVSC